MKEYFEKDSTSLGTRTENILFSKSLLVEQEVPIEVAEITWKVLSEPERFYRKFEFKERKRLIDFTTEVLHLEDEMNHHASIVIKHKQVELSVHTHTLEKITELDQEFIRAVDEIYEDIMNYGYEKKQTYEF